MKSNFQHFFEEHRAECICGAIAVVALLTNLGSIKQFMGENNQLRESMKVEQADNQRLQVEQLVSEQRKEVADERYRSNCVMIFSLNREGFYTAITEGEPTLKGELASKYRGKKLNYLKMPRDAFLPAGMTICDPLGNTAKLIKDPSLNGIAVARDLANTGDQALIKSAMERARGIYSNPVK
ncbi:hypothetical protein [Leptolyngbya sp. NIES-2104]|uniref:hypothetical protein n=1 Tax=Leptolyngbya sp. NIES-2104 TaxID=1552121 RepID=UPI0006ECB36A|nr:hypothetical protein [Leptolyngbya sp. NIES-2104]GAQ00184.1 hypothetical protein NIES2104_67490 [Leptolyngbya sp. NIES-2104]